MSADPLLRVPAYCYRKSVEELKALYVAGRIDVEQLECLVEEALEREERQSTPRDPTLS